MSESALSPEQAAAIASGVYAMQERSIERIRERNAPVSSYDPLPSDDSGFSGSTGQRSEGAFGKCFLARAFRIRLCRSGYRSARRRAAAGNARHGIHGCRAYRSELQVHQRRIGISNNLSRKPALYFLFLEQTTGRRKARTPPPLSDDASAALARITLHPPRLDALTPSRAEHVRRFCCGTVVLLSAHAA